MTHTSDKRWDVRGLPEDFSLTVDEVGALLSDVNSVATQAGKQVVNQWVYRDGWVDIYWMRTDAGVRLVGWPDALGQDTEVFNVGVWPRNEVSVPQVVDVVVLRQGSWISYVRGLAAKVWERIEVDETLLDKLLDDKYAPVADERAWDEPALTEQAQSEMELLRTEFHALLLMLMELQRTVAKWKQRV